LKSTHPTHAPVFAEHARANNYQIPLLSKAQSDGTFDQHQAYHTTAAIRQLREMNGEVVAGRKIGFTNPDVRRDYGVADSNWSYIYHTTVVDLPSPGDLPAGKTVWANISHLNAMEPRIEPELAFGLRRVPRSDMSDGEILACLDWMSHSYEIVTSVFPHWKFTAADATAAFGLHGLLLVGPRKALGTDEAVLDELKDCKVDLIRNGEKVAEGQGAHVLGSPVAAVRHLTELLASDEHNRPLEVGEIITTGSLTKAFAISTGDLWSTKISGLDLPGLDVKFKL
jgi:2-oxo-3-hexenedioate decarboxylase